MTYDELTAPWPFVVDQAWESFVAGSLGIGAVVTDRAGTVVSTGRNRITERTGPPGHLYGTVLAHAEMDALASLGTDPPAGLVMWSSLEPCLLCAGGIVLSDIRDVHYAAADPLWFGAERLRDLTDFLAERWPERSGPVSGPLGGFGALLPLMWFLRTDGEDGVVVRTYGQSDPGLLDQARRRTATAAGLAADRADARDAFAALTGGIA